MTTNKTVALNLRIHPDKKTALATMAIKQRLSLSGLVLPQIERLLEEGIKDLPAPLEIDTEGHFPLTGQISFRPLPGDEQHVKRYAATRKLKPGAVIKLLLRTWITKNAPMPKNELALLSTTSNQINAIGRNLNQLVKLAHSRDIYQPEALAELLQETLLFTRQASQEIDDIIKTNLDSWIT